MIIMNKIREEEERRKEKKEKNEIGNGVGVGVNCVSDSKLFFESLNSSLNRWLTTKEASEYFRTTPGQIRKWVYQGKIRAYKLCGKSLRFKLSELDLLLKGGRTWG